MPQLSRRIVGTLMTCVYLKDAMEGMWQGIEGYVRKWAGIERELNGSGRGFKETGKDIIAALK